MKWLKHLVTASILLTGSLTGISVAEADSAGYDNALNRAESLARLTTKFNEKINSGKIQSIDSLYETLNSEIKAAERAIGKVASPSTRRIMLDGYVRPAKIAKERVIYEVSEYRLLEKAGIMASQNNPSLISELQKLARLKTRAKEIKKAGGYKPVPDMIPGSLLVIENALRNGTFVKFDPKISHVFNDNEVMTFIETNLERFQAGLSFLTLDEKLSLVAREKSIDLRNNNYFDHNSPRYGTPFEMMTRFGLKYVQAGENLAAGYTDYFAAMEGWMKSPGHKANILEPGFTLIGVGFVSSTISDYDSYWTQMFIRP